MRRPSLNPRVQVTRPGGSQLVRDYFSGSGSASRFYAGHPDSLDALRRVADAVDARFSPTDRRDCVNAFRGRASADHERLSAFVESGGFVVTTGQQAGFLTGPLFTVYKAATAIALAKRLEQAMARPVLPVFWVASEDHDWEEASHTFLLNGTNDPVRIDAEPAEPPSDRPVFRVPLSGIEPLIGTLEDVLIPSEFREDCLALVRGAYRDGASLADGFEHVLDALMGDQGLLIVRAEDPVVKSRSKPVLRAALERGDELEAALVQRSAELEGAGYHDQVALVPHGLQLFHEGPEGRVRLFRDADGVRVGKEGSARPLSDWVEALGREPGRFSPNALLRPLAEAASFPVLAYVAGPGEAAYYAQNQVLYDLLGLPMPVITPRASVRVIEPKVDKVLEKYELDPEVLERPLHELVTERAKDEVPDDVKTALASIRRALGEGTAALLAGAKTVDPTLKGPIGQARNQSLRAFADAEKKILQAVKRQNETLEGQLSKARSNLYPTGVPQERILNVFHYLARYGPDFVRFVSDEIDRATVTPA